MVVIIGSTTVCHPTTRHSHSHLYGSPRTTEPPTSPVAEAPAVPPAVRLSHEEYTVGWICPLPINMHAARVVLDDTHEILPNKPGDRNVYLLGRIGQHNIVITSLEERKYDAVNAAVAAANMHRSFPSIFLHMVVGIAGGVPQSGDIRLGDVVVGTEVVEHGLVRKTLSHRIYERTIVHKAPKVFSEAISRFEADRLPSVSNMLATLADVGSRNPVMANAAEDRLFDSGYDHRTGMSDCNSCGEEWEIDRARRATGFPRIHYGLIASGTQVIKHGETRDKTAELLGGVLCFEVETAGVMDLFPCLAVRGISNYADSHKDGLWEGYASAAAAAYARELLIFMSEHEDSDEIQSENDNEDISESESCISAESDKTITKNYIPGLDLKITSEIKHKEANQEITEPEKMQLWNIRPGETKETNPKQSLNRSDPTITETKVTSEIEQKDANQEITELKKREVWIIRPEGETKDTNSKQSPRERRASFP